MKLQICKSVTEILISFLFIYLFLSWSIIIIFLPFLFKTLYLYCLSLQNVKLVNYDVMDTPLMKFDLIYVQCSVLNNGGFS